MGRSRGWKRKRKRRFRLLAVVLAAALLAAGCENGSGGPQTLPPDITVGPIDPLPQATPVLPITLPPQPIQPPLVDVAGGEFVLRTSGAPFVVRGTNYNLVVDGPGGMRDRVFSPPHFDDVAIRTAFEQLADRGYNTVRLFLDGCNVGPDCITDAGVDGLNGAYLDRVAETMRIAQRTGIMLILTSNDLPDGGQYRTIANRDNGPNFPGYRNSDFLTASGHEAMERYWRDLMQGLAERQAPMQVVLGWSILNEHWLFTDQPPLSLTAGSVTTATGTYDMADAASRRAMIVDATRAMITRVRTVIRSVQPDANVTMGFFAPQFPNPTTIGGTWHVDTAPLVERSDLDFFDFHFYAGSDISVAQAATNFGITNTKPTIMGEYGVFVHEMPTSSNVPWILADHVAESCDAGWDGWLFWSHLRIPLDDATWALTDDGNRLLDRLAPANDPDPCDVGANPNFVAGATVTASNTLAEHPIEHLWDGSSRRWSSGSGPTQWVEIDLGSGLPLARIELVVDQSPEEERTVHIVEWGPTREALSEGHRFDQVTSSGDVLVVDLAFRPTVRFIRIRTVTSPSWVAWREINVFGRSPD